MRLFHALRFRLFGLPAMLLVSLHRAASFTLKTTHLLEKIMSALDELLAAVEAQQTKIDSLIALTNGLHQQVLDAMGESITPSQKMRIDAVFKAVEANSADIDAAITANTIAAASGAISGGPSAAEIKASIGAKPMPIPRDADGNPVPQQQGSTESGGSATQQ